MDVRQDESFTSRRIRFNIFKMIFPTTRSPGVVNRRDNSNGPRTLADSQVSGRKVGLCFFFTSDTSRVDKSDE